MRILAPLAAALLLAACASTTPYQPIDGGRYGYDSTMIEADRARIVFRGNSLTPRQTVENYLLYRAAELTLEKGYDHFLTTDQAVQAETQVRQVGGVRPAFAGYYYPYGPLFYDFRFYSPVWGWRPYYDPFFYDPINFREITQFEATAEIVMRRGEEPESNPNAYDAREVIRFLQDQIRLPEE